MVLAAPDERALVVLSVKLNAAGIRHALIREPDAPYFNAATALGIVPGPRGPLRRFTSKFKLFGGAL